LVARAVKRVLEAQYEDAVRTRVDRLYTAFIDLEEAQRSVSFSESGLRGLESLLKLQLNLEKTGQTSAADVARIKTRRDLSASAVLESKAVLQKAKLDLANLLNLSDIEAVELKVSGDLEGTTNQPRRLAPTEEMIRLALSQRPDLKAYRLGLARAHLDWLKVLIEPLNQVVWRRWPGEIVGAGARQERKAPPGNMTALITLPTMVRNRAKLKRASINVEQSRTELAKVERAVVLEVHQARLEYDQARSACDIFRNEVLPKAEQLRDTLFRQFSGGEVTLTDYLSAQQEYNDRIFQAIKASVRLRRSALALNTAVGARIMP
jgi:cobalt-zinc-cadmium efflux system outer membrane protein